jgi:hypothetical protein
MLALVIRSQRDALSVEEFFRGNMCHGLWSVRRPRHVEALEPLIRGTRAPVKTLGKLPEVCFPFGTQVSGSSGIPDGLISHPERARSFDQLPIGIQDLCADRIKGRKDGEHGIVRIHAMHPKVIPSENFVACSRSLKRACCKETKA